MVGNLTKSMNNMCISLTDRINILESNMSKDLAVLIEKKLNMILVKPNKRLTVNYQTFKRR